MLTQTVQFATNASGQRVRNIKGVQHVVLNMVMLRTGVHKGNLGPIYYSDEEQSRSREAWNMMPLVENHPTDITGAHISARQADVLEKSAFGHVLNAQHRPTVDNTPGSSFCEAWVNMDALTAINPEMAKRVTNGETIEVSTGLTLGLIEEAGEWQGQPYTHRAVNFRPDHVAFLPTAKGACSVAKGCGVGANLVVNEETAKVVNCGCGGKSEVATVANNTRPEYVPSTVFRVGNVDVSFSDVLDQARQWVRTKHPEQRDTDGNLKAYCDVYQDGIYPAYFVYSHYDRTSGEPPEFYRVSYTLTDSGKVSVVGAKTQVERQIQYVPVTPDEEDKMTTNAVVTPEVPVVNTAASEATPAVPATPASQPATPAVKLTLNQFVETAPADLRQDLTDAVLALNTARTGFISKIMAAPGNLFTVEVLNTMGLKVLESVSALITPPAPAVVANAAPAVVQTPAEVRVLNYAGSAGAPAPTGSETVPRLLVPGQK